MNDFESDRLVLLIEQGAGGPWRLSLSRAAARCVGIYPRIAGLAREGALLRYEALSRGTRA